jgi:mono/diheme cytochrome c family protein
MRVAICLAMMASVWSTQALVQAPETAPSGNVENGKKAFVQRGCWTCHLYTAAGGQGGGNAGDSGPRLAGRTPAWPVFSKYVRQPSDQMIPYTAKVLSDQELADIYAWLKSIPPPPALNSIPQLAK